MSDLVVRLYNVGFGDAVLVTIPERSGRRTVERNLLIDVGQVPAGPGGEDALLTTVVRDIARRTGGTVDLYVMTHEHLDHAQGLLAAKRNDQVDLKARYAWLTQSAHPDYYQQFPGAAKKLEEARLAYLDGYARFGDDDAAPLGVQLMLANNGILLKAGGGLKTADYVDHLRTIAPARRTHYVSRATKALASKHPFTEATITILAPEEDTSRYYGRYKPPQLLDTAATTIGAAPPATIDPKLTAVPPVGVDAGAFFDLIAARDQNIVGGLAQIDKAANNTSLVLQVEWRGWRLLFPGDAEERSWRTMHDLGLLTDVHFVKISHHGSVNGTDTDVFAAALLPDKGTRARPRVAAVSTHDDQWESVPDGDTLAFFTERCAELYDTRTVPDGEAVEIRFPG